MRPICRNIQNNTPYEYLGNDKFRNLITGKEGVVSEADAASIFKFNLELTIIFNEYPQVEKLISALKMKIEPNVCSSER